MERNIVKQATLKEFSDDSYYGYRSHLQDERLKKSIQQHGVLEPLWVVRDEKEDSLKVVAGHKRLFAARELDLHELPVRELEDLKDEKQAFLMALLSNFNQELSDYDRHLAMLKALKDFKFSEEEFLKEVLPALGLESQQRWMMETMRLAALNAKILEATQHNILPFKGITALLKFPEEDQFYFLEKVAKKLKFSRSDLQHAVDELYDLMRKNFASLKDVIEGDETFKQILSDVNPDLRQKTTAFMLRLTQKKNPRYCEKSEKFQKSAGRIENSVPGLKIEAPAFFEDEGMTLHLRLKNPKTLDQVLETLKEQRSSLYELFKIML